MAKLWEGRTGGNTDALADELNRSIEFDSRLYQQDIRGSMAHATMLGATGILAQKDVDQILDGLQQILTELQNGTLCIDMTCEDVHTFVEQTLTARIGEAGKKLHTARSRNDQVALDLRLYLKDEIGCLCEYCKTLIGVICDKAHSCKNFIMPGYTHLQRAQPITFGHHLMAYAMMLLRDLDRLCDCKARMDQSPIGACALAGTTYPIDRAYEAKLLGFGSICENSLDAVADRDFCVELLSDLSILMLHLSRFSEEILLWTSWEFGFAELSDAYTTGSSIMPQKKNSDMAELVRGKTGRVYGDLMGLLTTLKGLPLAYNKDLQEDKEAVFDACDTAKLCLQVYIGMIEGLKAKPENMKKAAQEGFLNATDFADYLVSKGLAFRDAYKISGKLVSWCISEHLTLEQVPLAKLREFCDKIGQDVYAFIDLDTCVQKRQSAGGTAPQMLDAQIAFVQSKLKNSLED